MPDRTYGTNCAADARSVTTAEEGGIAGIVANGASNCVFGGVLLSPPRSAPLHLVISLLILNFLSCGQEPQIF